MIGRAINAEIARLTGGEGAQDQVTDPETEAERCKHGIRHPWQCDECDRENPMPEGWKP